MMNFVSVLGGHINSHVHAEFRVLTRTSSVKKNCEGRCIGHDEHSLDICEQTVRAIAHHKIVAPAIHVSFDKIEDVNETVYVL
jgi:hypothetical protein